MFTYVVHREIAGIGLSGQAGQDLALARSTEAVAELVPRLNWCHSWVAADCLLSLYQAKSVADVLDHARLANLPTGSIARVLSEFPGEETEWRHLITGNKLDQSQPKA